MNFSLRVPGNAEKQHKNRYTYITPASLDEQVIVPMYLHLSLQKAELSPLETAFYVNCSYMQGQPPTTRIAQ